MEGIRRSMGRRGETKKAGEIEGERKAELSGKKKHVCTSVHVTCHVRGNVLDMPQNKRTPWGYKRRGGKMSCPGVLSHARE